MKEYMILTEKISNSSKNPKKFGTDKLIYRREIHTLTMIYDSPGIHISEIARYFNITKGAVSKTIKGLESKGLLTKYTDENNQTRTLASLTPQGEIACKAHIRMHEEIDREMHEFIEGLTDNQLDVVIDFLKVSTQLADHHI